MTDLAWIRPTARLLPWPALTLPLVVAGAFGALADLGGRPPVGGTMALAATSAAAAVPWCLDDPAHQLVAALPAGRRRRAAHRLVLAVPVLLVAWLVLAGRWIDVPGSAVDQVGPLLALAAIGVATAAAGQRWRPEAGALTGVVLPLALVAGPTMFGVDSTPDLTRVWLDHPWPSTAAAALAAWVALADPASRFPWSARPLRLPRTPASSEVA